jgi:hypothetical protein
VSVTSSAGAKKIRGIGNRKTDEKRRKGRKEQKRAEKSRENRENGESGEGFAFVTHFPLPTHKLFHSPFHFLKTAKVAFSKSPKVRKSRLPRTALGIHPGDHCYARMQESMRTQDTGHRTQDKHKQVRSTALISAPVPDFGPRFWSRKELSRKDGWGDWANGRKRECLALCGLLRFSQLALLSPPSPKVASSHPKSRGSRIP